MFGGKRLRCTRHASRDGSRETTLRQIGMGMASFATGWETTLMATFVVFVASVEQMLLDFDERARKR